MLVLLGLLQTTPPPLTNARVRAEFGPLGLVALTDVAQHAVYRLTRDAFSLTIGGTSYDSPGPPKPSPGAARGTGDSGAALRLAASRGLLAVVQNPFLEFQRDGHVFTIRYQPDMDWRAEYGPFASDRGLLAPVRLSGRYVPARMLPEWR